MLAIFFAVEPDMPLEKEAAGLARAGHRVRVRFHGSIPRVNLLPDRAEPEAIIPGSPDLQTFYRHGILIALADNQGGLAFQSDRADSPCLIDLVLW